jgi:hypothetical protein
MRLPTAQHPRRHWVSSSPKFCPTSKYFSMHLQEHVFNRSQASSFFGPFLKNKVSMLPEQPPKFFFQETHYFNSETHIMPMYNVSSKGCSQRHQGQGVQKVCPMRMPSSALRAGKGSHPGNGFCPQK